MATWARTRVGPIVIAVAALASVAGAVVAGARSAAAVPTQDYTTPLPVQSPVVDLVATPDGGAFALQHGQGQPTSALTHVLADGSIDLAFGTNGVVTVPMAASALALTSGGSLLVAGDGVRRYSDAGIADGAYAGTGLAVATAVADLAIDGADRAVLVDGGGVLRRLLPNGSDDPAFSHQTLAGVVHAPLVAVDGRDRPLVLLRTGPRDVRTPLLLRFTAAGAIDETFSRAGVLCDCAPEPMALTLDDTDRALVVDNHSVARFDNAGGLDRSFGVGGIASFVEVDALAAVAAQPGGGMIVAGGTTVYPVDYDGRTYDEAIVQRVGFDGAIACSSGAPVGIDPLASAVWRHVAADAAGGVVLATNQAYLSGPAYVARRSGLAATGATDCPASRYQGVVPRRVLDTRIGQGAPVGPVKAGDRLDVLVSGQGGIPTAATAVTLTVTAVNATDAGFVTIWPTGAAQPTTSVLNLDHAGETAAALVTVPIGVRGQVSLFTQRGADLLVDVSGYWAPHATLAVATVAPARIVDTRVGVGAPTGRLEAGQTITVTVDPTRFPRAASLQGTVTVTQAAGDGFVTMWSAGDRPTVSNLNFGVGEIRSNQFSVPVAVAPDTGVGTFSLYVHTAAHVVVDITGFVPYSVGPDNRPALTGLRGVTPTRVLDTRDGTGGTRGPVAPGGTITVDVGRPAGIDRVAGVVATLTLVDATAPGFVTAWAGGALPTVSNVNVERAGQTRPIQITVPVAPDGTISLFVHAGGHVLLDVSGYLI